MKVNTKEQAWIEANKIVEHDYEYDTVKSINAGYPIYWTTAEGVNEWIADLDDRLEINKADGSTTNIWIEEEPEGMEVTVILKNGHKDCYGRREQATVTYHDNGTIKFYNVTNRTGFTVSYRIEQIASIRIF